MGHRRDFPSAVLELSLIPESGLEQGAPPSPSPPPRPRGLQGAGAEPGGQALRQGALAFQSPHNMGRLPSASTTVPSARTRWAQAPAWHRAAGHGALEQPVLPCQTGRITLSPALWVRSRRSPAGRGTSPKSMPPGTLALRARSWPGPGISSSVLSAGKHYLRRMALRCGGSPGSAAPAPAHTPSVIAPLSPAFCSPPVALLSSAALGPRRRGTP